jgi:predicted HTH domain antitoxin
LKPALATIAKSVHVPSMTLQLEIPDDALDSLSADGLSAAGVLKLEVAVALYQRGGVSVGKAREIAGVSRMEFETILSKRNIVRNYSGDDLASDVAWVRTTN